MSALEATRTAAAQQTPRQTTQHNDELVERRMIDMPGWRPIMRQILSRVVLVSVLPMAIFYVTLSVSGVRTAALVTAGLYCVGLLARVLRRKPVRASAWFAAGLLGVRTAIVCCTSSAFLYFAQPVVGTVAVAMAFAATAFAGRPIIERLAHDFCPLPAELAARLRSARYFNRVSFVWTINYALNAAGTLWFLTSASLHSFLIVKSILGPMLTTAAVVASYLLFRATMRHHNVGVRFANRQGWAASPA